MKIKGYQEIIMSSLLTYVFKYPEHVKIQIFLIWNFGNIIYEHFFFKIILFKLKDIIKNILKKKILDDCKKKIFIQISLKFLLIIIKKKIKISLKDMKKFVYPLFKVINELKYKQKNGFEKIKNILNINNQFCLFIVNIIFIVKKYTFFGKLLLIFMLNRKKQYLWAKNQYKFITMMFNVLTIKNIEKNKLRIWSFIIKKISCNTFKNIIDQIFFLTKHHNINFKIILYFLKNCSSDISNYFKSIYDLFLSLIQCKQIKNVKIFNNKNYIHIDIFHDL